VPSSRLALIALLCSIAYPTFAQETANNKESSILTDPENGHIKLFRYTIAPHDELVLPKLSHESVVICFECEQIKRTPGQGAAEVWDASPGRAIWNHSNTSYWFLNESDISAKIVVVEVKDYFKFDETRVPSTDYDPVLIDSRHYQILFENDGVRLLRLRLGPREETQDVQLPLHLQIALSDVHANIVPTVGKVKEERNAAGTAAWKRDELRSVVNLSDQALDEVLLEWKSPFCYSSNSGWELMKDADDPTKKYVEKVFEATRKIWFKEAGKIARRSSAERRMTIYILAATRAAMRFESVERRIKTRLSVMGMPSLGTESSKDQRKRSGRVSATSLL
jgi:hypothetical protein